VPVPLAVSEIPAIVERFADAAARLERCGWDGCEVTSFGGHLIEQFFDPGVNTRTDEYGGSLENRTGFGREVLEAVRAAVSDTFIVAFRMAVDQCLTGELAPGAMVGRVVVVGGGVAGLEAARGAALRGHEVVLFERRSHLGGRARLAAA
jgi:2,4-dienoyl-CoA reductase-like NADH-dependent reductase (Old Yellow Enzyme family)